MVEDAIDKVDSCMVTVPTVESGVDRNQPITGRIAFILWGQSSFLQWKL